jgi:hypothetical protein
MPPLLRVVLIAAAVAVGLFEVIHGRMEGLVVLGGALVLVYLHVFEAPVIPAFRALERGDMARARALSARVKDKERLSPRLRAYHEWTEAGLAEAEGDRARARHHLEQAVARPLRTERHRVIALATLASICHRLGDDEAARARLEEARAGKPPADLERLIAKVEDELPEPRVSG